MPGETATRRLRARVAERLRGTEPGGDAFENLLRDAPPEMVATLRAALPTDLARAAVLIPIVDRPDALSVLLTLRASHLKFHAGQISFPGGRIEAHDPSPWDAALRETEEEIGLTRDFVSLAGYLCDQIVPLSGFQVTPAVAFVRPGFGLQLDRTEVDEVFEVPLEVILDPAHHVPNYRDFRGHTVLTYEIPFEGRRIWGATARMLVDLAHLIGKP
jgi:8-oxo-dGTP pyrophosphatase MutT (NUDIX family)